MSNFENTNIIGQRIKLERTRMKLTQTELGEMLNVTKQTVSNWENGNRIPETVMVQRVAELFGVTTDFLLGYDSKRNRTTEAYNFEQNIKKLNPERQMVFRDFANMTDDDFEALEQFAEFLKSKKKKGE